MSDNIENISSASEDGVESVERLNSSIEKVNRSLAAIDVGGLEEMEDIVSSVNKLFDKQKKALDEILSKFTSLKEEIELVGEAEEETNETTNDGTLELMENLGGVQDGVSGAFKTIAGTMAQSDKAFFNSISLAMLLGSAFSDLCGGLYDLTTNWDSMSDMEKGIGILQTAAAAMILFGSSLAFAKLVGQGGILGLIIGGIAIAGVITAFTLSATGAADLIKNHAAGGGFNTADLFYANEDGNVELIASSNSGGGAVMNMEQLRSAVYDGVFAAMTEGGSRSPGVVVIDGVKAGKLVASGVYNEGKRVGYWR